MTNHLSLNSSLTLDQWIDQFGDLQASTSGVAPGAGTSASGSLNGTDGLFTPDAIMAYCETRLNTIDGQMQAIFNQQTQSTQFISDVNNVIGTFNQYANGINNGGSSTTMNATDFGALVNTLNTLQNEAPPGSTAATAIQNALSQLTTNGKNNGGTDTVVSSNDIATIVQDLQGVTTDANSSSQMNMILLNQLASEEQTAVQLTSNLEQTQDQTMNSITNNMKTYSLVDFGQNLSQQSGICLVIVNQ